MNTLVNLSYIGKKSHCSIKNIFGLLKNNVNFKQYQTFSYNKQSLYLDNYFIINSNFQFKERNINRYYHVLNKKQWEFQINKNIIRQKLEYLDFQFKKINDIKYYHVLNKNPREFKINKNIIKKKIDEKRFFNSIIEEDNSKINTVIEKPRNFKNLNYSVDNENILKNDSILDKRNENKIKINKNNNAHFKEKWISNYSKNNLSFLKHIPNILCISRILTSPIIGFLIIKHKMKQACTLYIIAGITDFLDGYLARKCNWSSKLGSVVDPLADKILMIISTISLSISQLIPKYLAYTILSRDILLLLGSIVLVGKKFIDTRSSLSQLMDISIKVKPSYISKLNTTLQIILLSLTIISPELLILKYMHYVVFSTTLFSGMNYFINRNAIDISFNDKEEKENIINNVDK
ncbi:CDP-alcohol phosphatidyltransferase-domain-containing protein [Neocallimastix sp. 'constans']